MTKTFHCSLSYQEVRSFGPPIIFYWTFSPFYCIIISVKFISYVFRHTESKQWFSLSWLFFCLKKKGGFKNRLERHKKSVRVITKRTQCFAVSLFIIHRRATCFSALSFAYSGERAKLSFRNSNREPNNHDLLCSIIL